ncbi:MAG: hypothetical protein IJU25_07800 [Lachnospiraceae bacterium]|nr:hypothetical protein [Lachnospiraceae bacterium]
MKKFFTNVPLQVKGNLQRYTYEAVDNQKLNMAEPTSFPILTAVNGYVEVGEEFRIIAVVPESEDGRRNLEALRKEITELCDRKGILCPRGVETMPAPADERVANQVSAFQNLIGFVDDDDELFACITYGTKPLSKALLMAVQYAYRLKKNTSISGIVYGQVDRSAGSDSQDWRAYVYDETALLQVDELVRVLAERGVADPKSTISRILSL